MGEGVKRKRKGRRAQRESNVMNINSLMDIMVIILVFLLKQYGDDPMKVQAEDLQVPASFSQLPPEDATTITVSQTAVLVNDKHAVDIKMGEVDKSYKKGGDQGMLIQPLFDELTEAVKRKRRERELLRQDYEPMATIIADQSVPYRLVTEVIYTAGQAELSKYKIAVIKVDRHFLNK